ncbi:hypothetical protein [Pseudomonas allokribbensis]|uniref:hypothetical protein n=1 Tax=Pseudomonas allokribbensis TaxID=2774460 RepID=UPI001788229F|nr:hypothetical protein [Pseudomonas allokribbensis]
MTLPLRSRKGFVLAVKHEGRQSYYELLPSAGIIRLLPDFSASLIGGVLTEGFWGNARVIYRDPISVPFDWDAHTHGSQPRKNQNCMAIIDQFGETFTAQKIDESYTSFPCTLKSQRLKKLTSFISHTLFFVDEEHYRSAAYDETKYDKEQKIRDNILNITKSIVPFWGSIEDLASGDAKKIKDGFLGIFIDIASFLFPIGKFASGSMRLVSISGKLGVRATLPSFMTLTKKLFITTLNNLNPIDGIPTLLGALGAGVSRLGKFGLFKLKGLAGRTGQYDFVQGLPQATDPGRWKPLAAGDQLGSVNGIEDIVLRRTNTGSIPSYHPVDPHSGKPYGPPLADKTHRLTLGRSSYAALEATDQQVTIRVAESAKIRSIPEIEGRTTLFIDDVPYRLDGDRLRRIELIDESENFKRASCRIKRVLAKGVCINEFVTDVPHDPIDIPALHSFDETKGYAPWFGERRCTPLARSGHEGEFFLRDGVLYRSLNNNVKPWTNNMTRLGFPKAWPQPKAEILADVQFQKGMYARIEIQGTYTGSNELHRVGAIVVPSIGDDALYLFTRVNSDKCYLARLPAGQKLSELQTVTMKRLFKAELEKGTLGEELLRIHNGSLTANNMAAIYGVSAVENAIESMERIAIRVGVPRNPPYNMKFVKVDTRPGEALLFDNSTRMIVTELPDGTDTWKRSRDASPTLRRRTADVFDTLFQEPTIKQAMDSVFRIDRTMVKLQDLLPRSLRPHQPRNIAYAEVTKADGTREVYVSVSGEPDTTSKLPLFKAWLGAEEIRIGDTTYFNIDANVLNTKTSLLTDSHDNLLAIPKTYPKLPDQPTSVDSESKLIGALHKKYPDKTAIRSVNIATTMPPCESCAVIIKLFGYTGGKNALNVIWK